MARDLSGKSEPPQSVNILHAFADRGVESQALSNYGTVTRVSIAPRPNDYSSVIQADVQKLPFDNSVTFDLGVFHPPCTKWSDMPSTDYENAENLIPAAREAAQKYCEEYIIENKPKAPLQNPTVLSGKTFGLPIKYDRGFETSFGVPEPPEPADIETEISPYFFSDRSRMWWASVKGYTVDFPKQHLAKNSVPKPYMDFLMQAYLRSTNRRDADYARSSHNDTEPLRLQ